MGITGSKAASTEFGIITIQCSKPLFVSGGQIEGIIYLNILKPYHGTNLVLYINGKERCNWSESSGSGKDARTHSYEQNLDTLKRELSVYSFPGETTPPGQYAFPFSFVLPNNLAGSVVYNQDAKGSVAYSIEAKLETNKPKEIESISLHVPVIVRELVHKAIEPADLESSSKHLCCCFCCFGRGITLVKFTTDKNAYMPGETIQTLIDVDNSQSAIDISSIVCNLAQNVTLHAPFNDSKKIERKILTSWSKQRVKAGEKSDKICIELVLPHEKISEETEGGITPSSNGKAVQVTYSVDVQLETGGCLCNPNPSWKLYVQIYSGHVQLIQEFAIPAEWNVKQMPTATSSWGTEDSVKSHMPLISSNQMSQGVIMPEFQTDAEAQRLNQASPNQVLPYQQPQQQEYGQTYYATNNKDL